MADARDMFVSDINSAVNEHSQMLYQVAWDCWDDSGSEYFNADELDDAIEYAVDIYDKHRYASIVLAMWDNNNGGWKDVIFECHTM